MEDDQENQIDLLDDSANSDLQDSDEDAKVPDVKAIEKNLRRKIELKQIKKQPEAKKERTPLSSATTKSFIEQQI